ncbi:MAG: polyprenyl synthetase family protein [Dehalococcoidia bacterium]|nr:polyprenyl synthetase family protein [Dehalococcoidia bacterium]MDH4299337.1 polyprenyl synthetase family protein [Dehalococcoidia bacterium]
MVKEHELPSSFASYRDTVIVESKKIIDSCPPALGNILRYHMGWRDEHGHFCRKESGKFIRSILCLLSCRAVGGDTSQAIPAAAAIELMHNFSLIHDDIEDTSYERHHRPTVWKLWGESQAINAGDAMFALAYSGLLRLKEKGIAAGDIVNCIKMLSEACLELCEGQYLDVEYENRLDVTVEDYLDMAAKKTAALFAVATSLGAYLGNEDSKLVASFRSFGGELGMVFQIHDDILGIWGAEESVGKSAGDVCQRKKTLPVAYGLQNSKGTARKRLRKRYSQESIEGEDIKEVTKILDDLGARNYAENLAEQYYYRALAHLEASCLDTSSVAPLKEAAGFLFKRDF